MQRLDQFVLRFFERLLPLGVLLGGLLQLLPGLFGFLPEGFQFFVVGVGGRQRHEVHQHEDEGEHRGHHSPRPGSAVRDGRCPVPRRAATTPPGIENERHVAPPLPWLCWFA